MSRPVLGLDIGGANVKAAHAHGAAHSRPFALWKHPERLTAELRSLCGELPAHDALAVTMTGELCDCFATKSDGVRAILHSVAEAAAGLPVAVWTTAGTFVPLGAATQDPRSAAAANWLALAHYACRFTAAAPALLLDIGSTTTDIVCLADGRPAPRGRTDNTRLATGELVYTGVRRTPICAVLGMGVAAEWFATMLDAYLWLGAWPEDAQDTDIADGRPATRPHARARLARLVCADADELPPDAIDALARQAIERQVAFVAAAVERVLEDRPAPQRVILAGSGEVLGRRVLAAVPRLRTAQPVSLREQLGGPRSDAACAYAVATLAAEAEAL